VGAGEHDFAEPALAQRVAAVAAGGRGRVAALFRSGAPDEQERDRSDGERDREGDEGRRPALAP
jgi:hypothetical protein